MVSPDNPRSRQRKTVVHAMSLALHRIKIKSNDQRLRPDAPFPSQVEDAQHAIRQWRHEQLIRRLNGAARYQDDCVELFEEEE